jgi:hypothetical protein
MENKTEIQFDEDFLAFCVADGRGLIPCFGCGEHNFLHRGYCRYCNPESHFELQESIKNAPALDSY